MSPVDAQMMNDFKLAASLTYVATTLATAIGSYHAHTYEFDPTWLFTINALAGTAAMAAWWGREIRTRDYVLPAVLMALAFVSYPSTSRDPFHYLFDGQTIAVHGASPYSVSPSAYPVDQYSTTFRDTYWFRNVSPYGPLWQAMMWAVNIGSQNHLIPGLVLLKLLNGIALVACAQLIGAQTGKAFLGFILLMNPLMLVNSLHTPHTDTIIAAFVLAAIHQPEPGRRSFFLALAALIKPHTLILAPFFERSFGRTLRLCLLTTAATALVWALLAPIVGTDILGMVDAEFRGSSINSPDYSLLIRSLVPAASRRDVFAVSYAVFLLGYGGTYLAFLRRRVESRHGMVISTALIPLLLYGLVYPWHFIVPLAVLALSSSAVAAGAVAFTSVLAFRAPLSVLKFVGAGLVAAVLCLAGRRLLSRASSIARRAD